MKKTEVTTLHSDHQLKSDKFNGSLLQHLLVYHFLKSAGQSATHLEITLE
jgi:hypothetical protein